MRKVLIVIIICLINCTFSFSQLQKKDFKIGGALNSNGVIEKTENWGVNFALTAGFMMTDKFELGIGLDIYKNLANSYDSIFMGVGTSLGYIIFANKYILIDTKLSLSISLTFLQSFSSNHYPYDSWFAGKPESKGNTIYGGLSPGLSYFLTRKIILTASFGAISFSRYVEKDKYTKETFVRDSEYGINLDTNTIKIGIYYIF